MGRFKTSNEKMAAALAHIAAVYSDGKLYEQELTMLRQFYIAKGYDFERLLEKASNILMDENISSINKYRNVMISMDSLQKLEILTLCADILMFDGDLDQNEISLFINLTESLGFGSDTVERLLDKSVEGFSHMKPISDSYQVGMAGSLAYFWPEEYRRAKNAGLI